ncbi:hypothetical protein BKK79_27330 [Cupriavidus sp. USMAA2-4]|uniref:OB-fold nucleic acid binding domain-containing protein n=1 Tax=Cupriavidus sp. USMAA2-4 TaxID=876364 RepID=UPI0008A69D12|nr:OB-fold nucleic acid binding domain-containing protein [Cupriavidus sp. USMAA2-4]AOY95473.1 hypothetical protein BKK79_27330 [Cupriavidus sp. USMAA2-4]
MTVRQRGTVNGVTFVSLEDETSIVNVIIWPDVFERYHKEILGSSMAGVYGQWQREGERGT